MAIFPCPDITRPTLGKKPVIILTGPTASGKSALGIEWAQKLDGVIINGDSQQVYQELQVLSARPSAKEEEQVPHKLYGFKSIVESYSANIWRQEALTEIDQAHEENKCPIVLGGTGFYLRSLMQGLSPLPSIPIEVREQGTRLYKELGAQKFHEILHQIDPQAAERLEPNDRQRCIHAWEVYEVSGQTLSYWQNKPLEGARNDLFFYVFVLLPERELLYDKINRRFDMMMELGALEEVKAVHALNPDPLLPGIKACGLPALRAFLEGEMTWDDAIALGKKQTRHYAKRQCTWMHNQFPDGKKTKNMHITHLTKS